MHALVDAPHVDHLHPDSGIALATAADGERLTRECFGDAVVWVPWRRPGFQLGLDIAEIKAQNPDRKSTRLNSSHVAISYAVFCLKKKNNNSNDCVVVVG